MSHDAFHRWMRSCRKNEFSNTHHCCRHFKPGTTGIFHLHNCSGSRPMLPVVKKRNSSSSSSVALQMSETCQSSCYFLSVCLWWIAPHLRYLPLCYTLYIDSIHLKVICICVLLLLVSSTMPAGVWAFKSVFQFFFVLLQKFLNVNVQRLQVFASMLSWTFENRAMVFMSVLCSKSPTLLSGQPQHMLSLSNDSFF